MTINRYNYEEFFMLYADGELSGELRHELEDFVAAHPDLKAELALLEELKFQPDEKLVFDDKFSLLKSEMGDDIVDADNYEWLFIRYQDGELDAAEMLAVDEFLARNPQCRADFEILQRARLVPDGRLVFRDKEVLFRHEKERRIIAFRLWVPAAAAVVLILAGLFWIMQPPAEIRPSLAEKSATVKDPAAGTARPAHTEKLKTNNADASTNLPGRPQSITESVAENKKSMRAAGRVPGKKGVAIQEAQISKDIEAKAAEPENGTDVLLASREPSIEVQRVKKPDVEAKQMIIDKPANLVGAPQESSEDVNFASQSDQDKVEILNTSVTTKNSLRVFLRKTSRMIAKKSSLGNEEGEHKGILIGGFEIAVK